MRKVFELLGEKAEPKRCKAMMGLVKKARSIEEGDENPSTRIHQVPGSVRKCPVSAPKDLLAFAGNIGTFCTWPTIIGCGLLCAGLVSITT